MAHRLADHNFIIAANDEAQRQPSSNLRDVGQPFRIALERDEAALNVIAHMSRMKAGADNAAVAKRHEGYWRPELGPADCGLRRRR